MTKKFIILAFSATIISTMSAIGFSKKALNARKPDTNVLGYAYQFLLSPAYFALHGSDYLAKEYAKKYDRNGYKEIEACCSDACIEDWSNSRPCINGAKLGKLDAEHASYIFPTVDPESKEFEYFYCNGGDNTAWVRILYDKELKIMSNSNSTYENDYIKEMNREEVSALLKEEPAFQEFATHFNNHTDIKLKKKYKKIISYTAALGTVGIYAFICGTIWYLTSKKKEEKEEKKDDKEQEAANNTGDTEKTDASLVINALDSDSNEVNR